MAEIEKKFNLYGANYPNQSKSRPCLLSILDENYNYFLLYLGFFLGTYEPRVNYLKRKTFKSRSKRSSLFRYKYCWASISNYVCNTILVITKIYIFLLYFILILLWIMQSQPTSIRSTVTSTAAFYHWSYTEYSVLWNRCFVYIWHQHSLSLRWNFLLVTSYFLVVTSYFLLVTSYFLLVTSY